MTTKRIHAFVLAAAVTALMGSVVLAQVDPSLNVEPGGDMMTPVETPSPSLTQTPSPAVTQTPGTPSPNVTTTTAPRNDGFGWGWIGLLGLIGLTGLGRRDTKHVEHDATYPVKRADATAQGGLR